MLKQLRLKFIVIILSIVTVMLCVIFGLTIHTTQRNLEESSLHAMQQAASSPGPRPDRFDGTATEPNQRIPLFVLAQHKDGSIITVGSSSLALSADAPLQELWDIAQSSSSNTGIIEDYDLRFVRISSPAGNRYVFADISHERLALTVLYRNCAVTGSVIFLLFIPLSILLANWAIKPVEKAWDQQRQFVADASHELKTPLTVILTNTELLQSPSHDAAARQRFATSIQATAQQMRHLVDGLLELARADNHSTPMQRENVDLSSLTEECTLPFEALFFEKDLLLDCSIAPGITVSGDSAKLKQVLDILLDNAQKYATPGQITVRLLTQGKHCTFSIRTPGSPISKEDLSNIFRRFYRIDTARSRDGSYGLGLSIAQHIVQSHNGKIWAESDAGGNTFFVQLPTIQ